MARILLNVSAFQFVVNPLNEMPMRADPNDQVIGIQFQEHLGVISPAPHLKRHPTAGETLNGQLVLDAPDKNRRILAESKRVRGPTRRKLVLEDAVAPVKQQQLGFARFAMCNI